MSVVDTLSVVVITIILSYFTLVFGELVPKRIAMQKSMEMARLLLPGGLRHCSASPGLWSCCSPCPPMGCCGCCGMKTEVEEEQVTEDEIRMMIDLGNENGAIDAEEKELLHNVFDFSDQTVSDVMTRAADVSTICGQPRIGRRFWT